METLTENQNQTNQTNQEPITRNPAIENWKKCLNLNKTFKVKEFQDISGLSKNGAGSQIRRWMEKGLLEKKGLGEYTRLTDSLDIPSMRKSGNFQCDKCNKTFETQAGLNIHLYRHSMRGKRHGKKIGELNKLRNKKIRPEIKEILVQKDKICHFCPNCGISLDPVFAALNVD